MFKTILSLFIPTIIKSITSLIGVLASLKDVEEKGTLFSLSKKILSACGLVSRYISKGTILLSGIKFIGNALSTIGGIAKGRSLVSLLTLVSPAMDAYRKIKDYINRQRAKTMLIEAIKNNDSYDAVILKHRYKIIKDLATCRLIADKMYLDFSVKSMMITVRRKIAKMIGGIINRLSNIKVKNSKGKAAIKKIINGLKAIQKKIDVPEKKPSKFLKILAGTSAALGGLVFVAKHAAPFLPPPAGAITSMIGNVANYAKSGVDTVQEGVNTAKEIKEKIVDA